MKLPAALVLCLALAAPAAAQDLPDLPGLDDLPEPTRYLAGYVSVSGGQALPYGGHWGDKDAGFKASQFAGLAVSKRVDELLSYGLEADYAPSHKNRSVPEMGFRMFALSPFVKASFPSDSAVYYGVLGAGIYQWSSPAYTAGGTRYGSASGSSAGLSLGGGVSYSFLFGTRLGVELRWHHVFNVKGGGLDMGATDTLNAGLTLTYGVWKDRAKPAGGS